jgi:hypothetical protein
MQGPNLFCDFYEKNLDRSVSVLKKLSADSVCSLFSMTLEKLCML